MSASVPSTITINPAQAKAAIIAAMTARLSVMLRGSPGTGKSALIHEIARELRLQVIDIRLAQCDPTDLLGFPRIATFTREDGSTVERAGYVPMSTFPLEGDPLPKDEHGADMNGWLLLFDELNHADRAVQKASYKILLDRRVGDFALHPNIGIVAAGNLDTDRAFTEEMSTALQSRLVHLELGLDVEQWIDWAQSAGIDHRICSFIQYKPAQLYQFDPNHADNTYPAPRTWEFASRLVKKHAELDRDMLPLLAGTIGQGAARELMAFTRIYKNLLTVSEIVADPNGVAVPTEPSVLYALTGSLSENIDDTNIAKITQFLQRIPPEFQVLTLRMLHKRRPALLNHQCMTDWARKTATTLAL